MKPNYEIRVGLFTLIALILLVWGWGWLKSASLFHNPQRFVVRFHDVAGLPKSATVNINGVRVGNVEKIELKSKGVVLVHIKITSPEVVVTEGSLITIQTLGLVGAKYIEISLPTEQPGQPPPPAIPQDKVVTGEDPVRVELVVNDLATRLTRVVHAIKSDKVGTSLATALEHSGEAVNNINQASAKLNKNMDRLAKAVDSVTATSDKIGQAASQAQGVVGPANSFFSKGAATFESIEDLAKDLHGTTKRVNKMLENPALSQDLKETAQLAKQTADTVSVAMHALNTTLKDGSVRKDIIEALGKLNSSTENIHKSVQLIDKVAGDTDLRSDLKDVIANAKDALVRVDNLMNQPDFTTDLKQTMGKVKTAAANVDFAARQISQVLNQRAPLLKMMFGRPGIIYPHQPDSKSK
ncbi:MAG: MCE family protein [Candidatus Melainabacteria bacterium]|nr:MCE family protein [Candidatus Melainabacteria bacterium]